MNRRAFLTGLIAAPVIVRCTSLMQIRGVVLPPVPDWVILYRWNGSSQIVRAEALSHEHNEARKLGLVFREWDGIIRPGVISVRPVNVIEAWSRL